MDGWVTVGSPLLETGGTSPTANTGSPPPDELLAVEVLAGDTIMPYPWVYCRVVLTHDVDGRSASFTSRTPTTAGVSTPLIL